MATVRITLLETVSNFHQSARLVEPHDKYMGLCWGIDLKDLMLRHREVSADHRRLVNEVSIKDHFVAIKDGDAQNFLEGEFRVGRTKIYIQCNQALIIAPSILTFIKVMRMIDEKALGEEHRVRFRHRRRSAKAASQPTVQ